MEKKLWKGIAIAGIWIGAAWIIRTLGECSLIVIAAAFFATWIVADR